jgi:hypothetical protein
MVGRGKCVRPDPATSLTLGNLLLDRDPDLTNGRTGKDGAVAGKRSQGGNKLWKMHDRSRQPEDNRSKPDC